MTADGRLLKASATENPDLFWSLRGGGGNFGLHKVGPVTGGVLAFAFDQAQRLLRFYDEFAASAPDELESCALSPHFPPAPKRWLTWPVTAARPKLA